MAEWSSITFKFDVLNPLKAPLEAILQVLEAIESILEALLDILKPFFLDLLNPLRAIIALILAAIRAIINQIRSSGFAVLLVHPDFSRSDFSGVINSVSGAYPGFESKVIAKFYDQTDLFRPQYPPGSSVAMIVMYIGADSPGDLLGQLMSLLALIKLPFKIPGLPAPVELKALPVRQSGNAITQFRSLFNPEDLNQAVQLEWRMPQAPSGLSGNGFVNEFSSFYNQFRFPNFIIERTGPFPQEDGESQLDPQGELIKRIVNTQTLGRIVDISTVKYNFPSPVSKVPVREEDGSVYRHFETKIPIKYGSSGEAIVNNGPGQNTSAFTATSSLVRGFATGVYRYLDNDPNLVPGKVYYYRVRAFFGNSKDYVNATADDLRRDDNPIDLVIQDGNAWVLRLSPDLTLSKPSSITKGFVPRKAPTTRSAFDLYTDIFNVIKVGILLNFEFPATYPIGPEVQPAIFVPGSEEALAYAESLPPENTDFRNEQRTGWGTLNILAGQMALLKSSYDDSDKLKNKVAFKATIRRLANQIAEKVVVNPSLENLLAEKFVKISVSVNQIVNETRVWKFTAITGGYTSKTANKIDDYLAEEEAYQEVSIDRGLFAGPYPVMQPGTVGAANIAEANALININNLTQTTPVFLGVQERLDIADFLRTAVSVLGNQTGYLSWYSVTVGDLFPTLTPFLFDFEQFILAFLKAVESALKEIEDIIQTLIQKIRALIQFLESIDSLIILLDVSVSVSLLAVGPNTNGSADSLVQDLVNSESKPGSSPYGLHSGLVMTFGGPGEGFVAAFNALKFILSFGNA